MVQSGFGGDEALGASCDSWKGRRESLGQRGRWFLGRTHVCKGLRQAASMGTDHPSAVLLEEGLCSFIYDKGVAEIHRPSEPSLYTVHVCAVPCDHSVVQASPHSG